jgi:hypothetical protein
MGIEIDDKTRLAVLVARTEYDKGTLNTQSADNLLVALTTLAIKIRPVTVETLRESMRLKERGRDINFYKLAAVIIGGIIALFSLCTFMSSRVSDQITKEIDNANALASKLRSELGPSPTNAPDLPRNIGPEAQNEIWFGTNTIPSNISPKDVLADLQQFAATMRQVDGYARELKYFLLSFNHTLYENDLAAKTNRNSSRRSLQLTPGLNTRLSWELTERVEEYQIVRSFANDALQKVAVFYGALATCVLPVLYALLGAVAYLLRAYQDQIKNRTLDPHERHWARFLIAGIGGLVVGLFNTGSVTISPFATAFLVGYAADVFFNFLEGFLRMFRGGASTAGPSGATK